jgi:hypothetical protein
LLLRHLAPRERKPESHCEPAHPHAPALVFELREMPFHEGEQPRMWRKDAPRAAHWKVGVGYQPLHFAIAQYDLLKNKFHNPKFRISANDFLHNSDAMKGNRPA